MQPQINEFWRTLEHTCLVVWTENTDADYNHKSDNIGLLWWDNIFEEWSVTAGVSCCIRKANLDEIKGFLDQLFPTEIRNSHVPISNSVDGRAQGIET